MKILKLANAQPDKPQWSSFFLITSAVLDSCIVLSLMGTALILYRRCSARENKDGFPIAMLVNFPYP